MPLTIDKSPRASTENNPSCSLNQCIDALADLRFEPQEPSSFLEAAGWLRRLTANSEFLSDMLIDRLSGRGDHAIDSGYGPHTITLSPVRGDMVLRANIWPAEQDFGFQSSGKQAFGYGTAHDHNFSFLTSGYFGPGYRSDHYEYDYEQVSGYEREPATLHFTGRSALHQGKLVLYRAHRDIHIHLPPESLSVSLSIIHVDPAQNWFDQYGFDLERREVSRVLSSNANEAFLRVAVASGSDEAFEYAEWIGDTHPSERLRLASFEARAAMYQCREARDALWRDGEACGSEMVAAISKKRRAAL